MIAASEAAERVVSDGWAMYDRPPGGQVCNCPALMGDPFPHWPTRWEEVPRMAYDPQERFQSEWYRFYRKMFES